MKYRFTVKLEKFWPNLDLLSRKLYKVTLLYIFRILQHFATKLCNFTNAFSKLNMLFLAVVMDFVPPAEMAKSTFSLY